MAVTSETLSTNRERLGLLKTKVAEPFVLVPLLGWIFGIMAAVLLEQLVGLTISRALGMPRIPALFGIVIARQKPELIPSVLLYDILIYVLPITVVTKISATPANWLSA